MFETPDEIEYAIKIAKKKAKGLQTTYQYEHHKGLEIRVRGPLDKIKLFQKDLLDTLKEHESAKLEASESGDTEMDAENFDSENENEAFFERIG